MSQFDFETAGIDDLIAELAKLNEIDLLLQTKKMMVDEYRKRLYLKMEELKAENLRKELLLKAENQRLAEAVDNLMHFHQNSWGVNNNGALERQEEDEELIEQHSESSQDDTESMILSEETMESLQEEPQEDFNDRPWLSDLNKLRERVKEIERKREETKALFEGKHYHINLFP